MSGSIDDKPLFCTCVTFDDSSLDRCIYCRLRRYFVWGNVRTPDPRYSKAQRNELIQQEKEKRLNVIQQKYGGRQQQSGRLV
jgi:hypothetical protein